MSANRTRTARNAAANVTPDANVPADIPAVTPDAPAFDPTIVPDGAAFDDTAVIAAYRSATQGEKARIRAAWDRAMRAALAAADFPRAAAINAITSGMVSAPSAPARNVDWNAVVTDRVSTLIGAAAFIMSGAVRPAGVPDDVDISAIEFPAIRDMIDAVMSADSASDIVRNANVIAAARITRSTDRRDIGAIIAAAFDGRDAGTFMSVADIRRAFVTANPDSDYVPGDGAIAARLFPANGTCTVPGITPVDATATNVRGAHN